MIVCLRSKRDMRTVGLDEAEGRLSGNGADPRELEAKLLAECRYERRQRPWRGRATQLKIFATAEGVLQWISSQRRRNLLYTVPQGESSRHNVGADAAFFTNVPQIPCQTIAEIDQSGQTCGLTQKERLANARLWLGITLLQNRAEVVRERHELQKGLQACGRPP